MVIPRVLMITCMENAPQRFLDCRRR
jgi:hypothetical protein